MRSLFSVAVFIVSLAAAQAGASTIALSNVPGTGSYDKPKELSTTSWEAVGLTTDATFQMFGSLVGVFAGGTTGGTLEGGIFADSGYNSPSTLLASFNDVSVAPYNTLQVPITTTSDFVLQPSTKYWFVLHDSQPFAWMGDNAINGTVPGASPGYTYDGFATSSNAGGSWATDNTNYTVQISTAPLAVPEPGTLALAAAALTLIAFVRKRKSAVAF